MRLALALFCLVAAVAAQGSGYGTSPNSVTLKNGTNYGASSANVPNFLTAEDRRFTVALNWLRQDPARWKGFMAAQGRWDFDSQKFLIVGDKLKANLALHYNPNIAAASHYHAYEMATSSPPSALEYDYTVHCPNPSKWPKEPCSPPDLFNQSGKSNQVECFRREGCYDPTVDYYNRMDQFGTPIYPAPGSRVAGGNFYAGGTVYTNDVERSVSAAMAIVCDSPFVDQPYNCTNDDFSGGFDTAKEILYKNLGLRIHGVGYYAATSKKVNYFDTYFAAAPEPPANPIASGAIMRVNGAGYWVMNYREPNSDTAVPQQVGVIFQTGSGITKSSLAVSNTGALVYTLDASSILTACATPSTSIPYCFFAVDSNGVTYRYPEDANLEACAGTAVNSLDVIADSGNGGVTNNVVNFQGTTQVPPTGSNPDLAPKVPFGGSSAAAILPAVALLFGAILAVLAL